MLQTGKISMIPFIFVDKKFWSGLLRWIKTSLIENDMIVSKLADKTMDDAFSEVNRTIKGHIEACISKYDDRNDDNVSYNDEGFDSFVKTSPLCAFISA